MRGRVVVDDDRACCLCWFVLNDSSFASWMMLNVVVMRRGVWDVCAVLRCHWYEFGRS